MSQQEHSNVPIRLVECTVGRLVDADEAVSGFRVRSGQPPRGFVLSHQAGLDEVDDLMSTSVQPPVEVVILPCSGPMLFAGFAHTLDQTTWRHLWPLWVSHGSAALWRAQTTGQVNIGLVRPEVGAMASAAVRARFRLPALLRDAVDRQPRLSHQDSLARCSEAAVELAAPEGATAWPSTTPSRRTVQVLHLPPSLLAAA